ncbi:hypothetical protein RD792_014865 [Penstemon davidsonii]|uniref:Morc S5 domain-containing protein n=1 Tax=Penstemon davidsonii TaxID=160366 RepID=A0ABR0CS15_9LAMI|nr:hypothetical protein RD792_014865 [Penstemon davidsonii]
MQVTLSNNHGLGEFGEKYVISEKNLVGKYLQPKFNIIPLQESNVNIRRRHGTEENTRLTVLCTSSHIGTSLLLDKEQFQVDDSSLCSTSSISPAPLCRQFWRAGNYDDKLNSKPTCQYGSSYLRIHPKFLHSNATSHKWAFGAMAELLDNSVDEIQNGATFVNVDKISNPRDGTTMLLVQDNGGGMDPDAMRRCISFGFSDKKSKTAIGQYGNGFKTSSMRLGADVIVFSRNTRYMKMTQSVGLLSYTFLMKTHQDKIVVPMVDYQLNIETGKWNTLKPEQLKSNLSVLLQWSPFTTEAELLKQCDDIGPRGTKIIIYNLWHNDEGKLELDFESDPEDICIRQYRGTTKGGRMAAFEQHLSNRRHYSLRAYLSILYLRIPENFSILLRGRVVEYHNIATDLKFPEFILYRPHKVEGSVVTTIGFLKEAPAVNIHGFNVYHKNRLILVINFYWIHFTFDTKPYFKVINSANSTGRGVVGVLEANFIQPTHNKQDFEKTPVFQKLETRLKDMTVEYWDYHCGLIGYQVTKKLRTSITPPVSSVSKQGHCIYQPVLLGKDSSTTPATKVSTAAETIQHEINASPKQSFHRNSQGALLKRKGYDHVVEPERVKRMRVTGSQTSDTDHGGNHAVVPANQLEDQAAVHIIQENKMLHAQCQEYEKTWEELNLKVTHLKAEVQEAHREYARLLLESKMARGYLRIHPKFLHSNATSHKWAFGGMCSMAELLDNSVDEIQNGATFVNVDKSQIPGTGTTMLLVQDNGGGMDPDAMRRCISFGFSDKKSKTAIGQYGNGFKTSSMRLGADVIVFSRNTRKMTQSVGLLSYTFLMKTHQDKIVVPMVDYQLNIETGKWNTLKPEQLKSNLSVLLQWSPFTTEAELLKQCDDIGPRGTKIIIYNLWHNDEGKLELDFESDPEDICIRQYRGTTKGGRMAAFEQHLSNRRHYSLRAYLSILYLRIPENFSILLRGRVVEYHNIATDLKFPEFILYRPHKVEGSVVTTIGFLKEAPAVNIHGFNVYHKNRLILVINFYWIHFTFDTKPYFKVINSANSTGRGVVGVLEANFIQPTHNKQDFEKTPVFQKLETRLKDMTVEYWDYHCGLIGYQVTKKLRTSITPPVSSVSKQGHCIYQPVLLGKDSSTTPATKVSTAAETIQHEINASPKQSFHRNSQGALLKRKGYDHVVEPERVKRMRVTGSQTSDTDHGGNHAVVPANQLEDQAAVHIIQENKMLHAQCQEYEKTWEELNLKVTHLKAEVQEAHREYARLLLESKGEELLDYTTNRKTPGSVTNDVLAQLYVASRPTEFILYRLLHGFDFGLHLFLSCALPLHRGDLFGVVRHWCAQWPSGLISLMESSGFYNHVIDQMYDTKL